MQISDWLGVVLPVLLLSGLGVLMMRSHMKSWSKQQQTLESERDREHHARRFRRRMQASGMLVLLGILISAGQFIDGKQNPGIFTAYWFGVLFLTFWLILLALGDAFSIASYAKVSRSELQQQRRQLEAELQRLKSKQGNGHAAAQEDSHD